MTEVDHTSSHNLLVNSWAARVNNAPKYKGIKAIQKYRNKFRTLLAKHKGLKFTFAFECKYINTSTNEVKTVWKTVKAMTINTIAELPQLMGASMAAMRQEVSDTDKPAQYQMRFDSITKVGLNVIK
jgi:hypothetical protein